MLLPRLIGCLFAGSLVLTSSVAGQNAAQASSEWVGDSKAQVRLQGPTRMGDEIFLGLEIALEEGWKTYWRHPGDAGIPPILTDQGSENLKAFSLHFPAPYRFEDPYGDYLGYKSDVVIPLKIQAKSQDEAIKVHFKLQYAACREICLPLDASLSLEVDPQGEFKQPMLNVALGKIAQALPVGKNLIAPPLLVEASSGEGKALRFTVKHDEELGEFETLIVEVEPSPALPLPRLLTSDGKTSQFEIKLTDYWLDRHGTDPVPLRYTMVFSDPPFRSAYEGEFLSPSLQ